MDYAVNQRVRELMKALGYSGQKEDAHKFGQILLGNDARTERVKNFYNDINAVSADLLVKITTKIVNPKGEKPNGHWLLTGDGEMFLSENHTQVHMASDSTGNTLGEGAARLYKELYEKFLGDDSKYLMVHKELLKDHRLVPLEKIIQDKKDIDGLLDKNERLNARVIALEAKSQGVKKGKNNP